jgi:hypothetical protein
MLPFVFDTCLLLSPVEIFSSFWFETFNFKWIQKSTPEALHKIIRGENCQLLWNRYLWLFAARHDTLLCSAKLHKLYDES